MKEDEMGRACGTHGGKKNVTFLQNFSRETFLVEAA
jgi:hypothetical protein